MKALKITGTFLLNVILVFIAFFLLKYLLMPSILVTILVSFYKNKIGYGFISISNYLRTVAISIDQAGNVICSDLFNITLIKKDSYKFGNPDETISGVLGKNQKLKALSIVGKLLNSLLNLIEKDHSIKAIEHDENNK